MIVVLFYLILKYFMSVEIVKIESCIVIKWYIGNIITLIVSDALFKAINIITMD